MLVCQKIAVGYSRGLLFVCQEITVATAGVGMLVCQEITVAYTSGSYVGISIDKFRIQQGLVCWFV
jgi:hypothetical protein